MPLNIAFWLVSQNNKNIKKAETPTPTKELKKNLVEISVSIKASNKFMSIKIFTNLHPCRFNFLLFDTNVISFFTKELKNILIFSSLIVYLSNR